jgi:hypothetical protein
MANKVYESPGFYSVEKDITYSTEVVGVTTLGLIGETVKGPAMQPIFITTYDQFQTVFGGTDPTKFRNTQIPQYELSYIAKSYLSQTNQLYVTRVLGLSGYNAGLAFVIRTIGNVNPTTLTAVAYSTTNNIPFYMDTDNSFKVLADSSLLIDKVATMTNVASTQFDTAFNLYFKTPPAPFEGNVVGTGKTANGLYWGTLSGSTAVQTAFNANVLGTQTDAYELPSDDTGFEQEHWLLNTFTLNTNPTGDTYTGYAFALFVNPNSIAPVSGHTVAGVVTLYTITYSAKPMLDYHNKTIATLRSRGVYAAETLNLYVSGTAATTVAMADTSDILTNPLANFNITGMTIPFGQYTGGTSFNYMVCLDNTQADFIKNVLGVGYADKNTYLYVEEFFPSILNYGYNRGYIKGLSPVIERVNFWNHYLFQYQSPATPFFVSELRGGLPQRLFRFISISDGNTANIEIKASVGNINLSTRTFDVYLRVFTDTDRQPNLVERYLAVTMDPTSLDYIGRRIGTADNMFALVSSYVMVDIDDNAPVDAVPAGFEGLSYRSDSTQSILVPKVSYKLKYDQPGEIIYTPPFSTPVYSTGDKVKWVYLGFSDTVGIDSDLFMFKGFDGRLTSNAYNDGNPWSTSIRGFHMDKNAASIVDSQGNQVFDVGVGQFTDILALETDTTEPYYDIRTRKFTACFAGGFDGWDMYRDYRTNLDDYQIGRTLYTAGLASGVFSQPFYVQGQPDAYGSSDYYAFLLAMQTMQNPEDVNINILATPGIDLGENAELINAAIEIVEEIRQDAIYLPTLPDMQLRDNTDPANTENWLYPQDVVNLVAETEIDSNYAAVYYPWYQIFDSDNNTNLFIPPTTDMVRNLALTDNIAYPWYATAGYTRGLVNAIRARIKLAQSDRDTLYVGRINPIATFSDVGLVIWGNRNMQIANSALNRLNIRRLLLQCEKLIGQVGNRLLFDPNDDTIRTEFIAEINPILDNIRKERGLTDFRVILLAESDAGDSDRNTLYGTIYLKPTPALEVIEMTFVVTPTSVSFDSL